MNTATDIRRSGLRLFLFVMMGVMLTPGLTLQPAWALTTEIATTTTGGGWTDPAIWACTPALSSCVPNNNASDVFNVGINGGAALLDNLTATSITIDALSVASAGGLDMGNGNSLALAGTNTLTNSGAVEVESSTLIVGGTLTNSGSVDAVGDSQLNVGGTLTNTNSGSVQVINGSLLTVGGTLTNSGSVEVVEDGSMLLVVSSLTNSGAVRVEDESSLMVGGTLNDAAGTLVIDGSHMPGAQSSVVTVTGAAPATFEGSADLTGNQGGALLSYNSGGITQLGGGGSAPSGRLTLDGATASVEIAAVAGNSALTGLTTISSNGTLDLEDDATVTTHAGVNLTNSGAVEVGDFSTLNVDGSLTNSGAVEVGDFSTLNVDGSLTNSGSVRVEDESSLTVGGTLNDASGTLFILGSTTGAVARVTVNGAAPGTFEGSANLASFLGGALLSYNSGGITQLGGGGSAPSGRLTLDGPTASVEIAAVAGNSALTGLTTIASNGTLDLENDATVTTHAGVNLTNNGAVLLQIGGTLNVGGAFTQSGGTTTVTTTGALIATTVTIDGGTSGTGTLTVSDGGAVQANTIEIGANGILDGVNGTLMGNVIADPGSHISPDDPGPMSILGNVDLGAGSTLTLEIASATLYDSLNITGNGTFNGTIDLDFLNGFAPSTGDHFNFITDHGGFTWKPSAIELTGILAGAYTTDLEGGFGLTATNNWTGTPEPASVLLLGTGILILLGYRRYRAARA